MPLLLAFILMCLFTTKFTTNIIMIDDKNKTNILIFTQKNNMINLLYHFDSENKSNQVSSIKNKSNQYPLNTNSNVIDNIYDNIYNKLYDLRNNIYNVVYNIVYNVSDVLNNISIKLDKISFIKKINKK